MPDCLTGLLPGLRRAAEIRNGDPAVAFARTVQSVGDGLSHTDAQSAQHDTSPCTMPAKGSLPGAPSRFSVHD
jgi:hypothetical protein